jgi:hypothetical protein
MKGNSMPTYTIKNKKTGGVEDVMMPYEEFEKHLQKNRNLRQVFKPVAIGDSVSLGITKPPSDFSKYVLGKVKATNPKSKVIEKRWNLAKEI